MRAEGFAWERHGRHTPSPPPRPIRWLQKCICIADYCTSQTCLFWVGTAMKRHCLQHRRYGHNTNEARAMQHGKRVFCTHRHGKRTPFRTVQTTSKSARLLCTEIVHTCVLKIQGSAHVKPYTDHNCNVRKIPLQCKTSTP